MSLSETCGDSLALAIANSGAWGGMAYFLPLVRLLANGDPVSREQMTMCFPLRRLSPSGKSLPG